jgi:hypothetical protein
MSFLAVVVVMQTTSKFFINNFSAFFKRDNTAKSSSFFHLLPSFSVSLSHLSLFFFSFLYILFHSQHVKLSYVIKIFYSIHHIIQTTNHEEMRMRREVKHQQQENRINESGCDISFLWISLFVVRCRFMLLIVQNVEEIRIKARAFLLLSVGE